MTKHERQYNHEYYLKNRERILARVKSYYQVNKEDIGFCQKVRRNYSQVEHCKMMIKHWERKLMEAEKNESCNKESV